MFGPDLVFQVAILIHDGKVDVLHLMRAIQKGADGAYIVGCLEGSCHFNEGNYRAKERVEEILASPQKNPLPDDVIAKLDNIMRRADDELK